jgi:predicted DNA-binding transcriptional regulator YafY
MRVERLLGITIVLLGRRRVPVRELAERFSVSCRTIHRDLDALSMAGVPVVTVRGSGGGVEIMEGYRLSSTLFNQDELLSSIVALEGLGKALDSGAITSALEKIKGLLSREEQESIEKGRSLFLDISPWFSSKIEEHMLSQIREAISKSLLISFRYMNNKGQESTRRVEPMSLVFKGYTWYLYGYCLLRDDYRFFKLSRMDELEITLESFMRREKELEKRRVENSIDWQEKLERIVMKISSKVRQGRRYFGRKAIKFIPDGTDLWRFSAARRMGIFYNSLFWSGYNRYRARVSKRRDKEETDIFAE